MKRNNFIKSLRNIKTYNHNFKTKLKNKDTPNQKIKHLNRKREFQKNQEF